MAISWMLISGLFGALSNLCMRKSISVNGTSRIFFIYQLLLTALVCVFLHPIRTGDYTINSTILIMGFSAGLFLAGMKLMLGKALERGPSGLTFAMVNSASVMPALLIGLFLGVFREVMTYMDLFGLILIVAGFFWAGVEKKEGNFKSSWILFSLGAFFFYLLFLILAGIRAYSISGEMPGSASPIFRADEIASEWFVPLAFAAASGMHAFSFFCSEKKLPFSKREVILGVIGGIFNGVCSFAFMYAAEVATLRQSSYIFSVFTISLVILCNCWGQWLYGEQVNWKANALTLSGLFVASIS